MSIHISPFSPMSGPGLGKSESQDSPYETGEHKKRRVGFHTMDPQRLREVSSRGGHSAHNDGHAHRWSPEEAREAAKKATVSRMRNRAAKAQQTDPAS